MESKEAKFKLFGQKSSRRLPVAMPFLLMVIGMLYVRH